MADGSAPDDLWHLTIDDLLSRAPEPLPIGGSGPYVINLSASTAPIGLPPKGLLEFGQLHVYQVHHTENGQRRYRLRLGPIATELEADALLATVREHYPRALTAAADEDDLRAIAAADARSGRAPARGPVAVVAPPTPAVAPPVTVLPTPPPPPAIVLRETSPKEPIRPAPIGVAAPATAAAPKPLPASPVRAAPTATAEAVAAAAAKPVPTSPVRRDDPVSAQELALAFLATGEKTPRGTPKAAVGATARVPPTPPVTPAANPAPVQKALAAATPGTSAPTTSPSKPATTEMPSAAMPPPPAPVKPLAAPSAAAARPAPTNAAPAPVVTVTPPVAAAAPIDGAAVPPPEATVRPAPRPAAVEPVPAAPAPIAAAPTQAHNSTPPAVVPSKVAVAVPVAVPTVKSAVAKKAPRPTPASATHVPTLHAAAAPSRVPAAPATPAAGLPVLGTEHVAAPRARGDAARPKAPVVTSELSIPVVKPTIETPAAAPAMPAAKHQDARPALERAAVTETERDDADPWVLDFAMSVDVATGPAVAATPAAPVSPSPAATSAAVTAAAAPLSLVLEPSHPREPLMDLADRIAATAVIGTSATPKTSTPAVGRRPASLAPTSPAPTQRALDVAAFRRRLDEVLPLAAPKPPVVAAPTAAVVASVPAASAKPKAVAPAPAAPAKPAKAPVVSKPAAPAAPVAARRAPPAASPPAVRSPPPPKAAVPVPAKSPPPAGKAEKPAAADFPELDRTHSVRALTPLDLAENDPSQLFAIQLAVSEAEFRPEDIPNLGIFAEYRLYSTKGLDGTKVLNALRLGFFTDETAAQAVAGYVRGQFEGAVLKRVSTTERDRFAERRVNARKDAGATGAHAAIELRTPDAAPTTSLAELSGRRKSDPPRR